VTLSWSKPDSNLRSHVRRPSFKEAAVFTSTVCLISRRKSRRERRWPVRTMRAAKKPGIRRCVKWLTHQTGSEGLIEALLPRRLGSVGDSECVMPRYDLWCRILSRIELDQRSREARLQLERIEWLLIPPAAGKRRLSGDGRGGAGTLKSGRIRRLLKARSSRVPPIVETRCLGMALSQVSPKPSYAIGP
jgi:hypothetical protein